MVYRVGSLQVEQRGPRPGRYRSRLPNFAPVRRSVRLKHTKLNRALSTKLNCTLWPAITSRNRKHLSIVTLTHERTFI
jgi:hypothetical protein